MSKAITVKGRVLPISLLIIIGILAMLLWWKSCGGNPSPNAFAIQMQKEKTADSLRMIDEKKRYEDSLKDLHGQMQLQAVINAEHEKNLNKLDKRIDQLLADHNNLPAPIPFDTNSSIVSNKWIESCSDCFVALKNGRDSVRLYIHERDNLDSLYKKDTALKSKRIAELESDYDRLDKAHVKLFNAYVKDTKPKASVSSGIEYNYSPKVTEIGAYLTYRSRKGHEVGIGGGANTLSNYYFSIRMGARIF